MLNKIKKLFSKNKEVDKAEESKIPSTENTEMPVEENNILVSDTYVPTEEDLSSINFDTIEKVEVVGDSDVTLCVLDDVPYTEILYASDFKKIKDNYNKNPYADFKVVRAYGENAGYKLYKYAIIDGNKIDYALLDITLGHTLRLASGEIIDLDGIDLAIMLKRKHPDIKFIFTTAHTLNKKYTVVGKYYDKLKEHLGIKLEDYYLSKNSNRVDTIYKFLYGDQS